ncbi:MAG: Hsp20/alpha crystallin family protein [Planctomycetota bacterium]|jgi:HSP20 family protein
MRLIPWRSEFAGVGDLRRQVNRLFEDFFEPGDRALAAGWLPAVNVSENPEAVVVEAEVPGFDPKQVQLSVVGDILHLRGEVKEEHESKNRTYHRVERRYGPFERSIPLPTPVNPDKIEAVARNLTVTLPKRESARARTIEIKDRS